jgi:hypothetical protein
MRLQTRKILKCHGPAVDHGVKPVRIEIDAREIHRTKLEDAIITRLGSQGYPYIRGTAIQRSPCDFLI